ncbi:hypothetical protein TL16_g09078 [Triparma laevis f. inornata]|uniref:Secreted protein n=1 Tax=Triparma laevis f. inornata TaxID=1714386 RepID=A0A9W7B8Q1_9STRA|nr:hypothetical protein TL16_g09078 [Triparma laevis f. inornata]
MLLKTLFALSILNSMVRASANNPPPMDEQTIIACYGMKGLAENCEIALIAQGCVKAPCSKLILVHLGGGMAYYNDDYKNLLADYATAGCWFDGTLNAAKTTAFLADGDDFVCSMIVNRWEQHYCEDTADCDLETNEDALMDSVDDVVVEDAFVHLKAWRMTSCGSQMDRCRKDVIPMEPQQDLCAKIAAAEGHSCEFSTLPLESHKTCLETNAWECRDWFDRLPEAAVVEEEMEEMEEEEPGLLNAGASN